MKRIGLFLSIAILASLLGGCGMFDRATPTPVQDPIATAVAQTLTAVAPTAPARTAAPNPGPTATAPGATPIPTESTVPLAFFESPQANAQFAPGESINVGVTALDNAGIARVELFADDQYVQSVTPKIPASTVRVAFTWSSTAVGNHTLSTIAYDSSNNPSAPAIVTIAIQSNAPTPVIQILAPANPQTIQAGAQLTVRVVADAPQGITQIQMLVDNQPYTQTGVEKARAPFPASFVFLSRVAGAHSITFRAIDAEQRVGVSTLLVVNVVDASGPVVNVSYSATAILRGANLLITILAADASGIQSIQVLENNVVFDTYIVPNPKQQASITLQRNWTSNVVGNHVLFVRVTDTLNQTTTSPATNISVLAPNQPTPTFTRVPPTRTPRPPATHTPEPPPAPSIQILSPGIGCMVQLPDAIPLTIQFNSSVGLRQLTTYAQYEGVMAQTIDVRDANGQGQYILQRDWVPSASGMVELFATATDVNGRRSESIHTGCAVQSPAPPTVVPPTVPPARPGASILSPAMGCLVQENDALHVIADFQGASGLSTVRVFAQYGGVMAQQIYSDEANGQTSYRADFDWNATAAGTVVIYATVQDLAGQSAESGRAACQIVQPAPPTYVPEPTEKPLPTFAPAPTEEPEPTLVPEPTEEPIPTFAPAPTEEPSDDAN